MLCGLEKLASVAENCVIGMQPLWPEPWVVRAPGRGVTRTVPVPDPSRCVRVGAAAGPEVTEIELVLRDPQGRPLARDSITGSVALIGLDGPVCADQSGPHQLHVGARGGHAEVSVQVWRAP